MSGIALLIVLMSQALANADDNDRLVTRLLEIWQGQRSEIVTANLKFRQLNSNLSGDLRARAEFLSMLESLDLINNPDDIRALAAYVGMKISPAQQPWGDFHLLLDPSAYRADSGYEGNRRICLVREANDEEIYVRWANNQVNIHAPGANRIKLTSLKKLRFIPAQATIDAVSSVERKGELVSLTLSGNMIEADESTGSVVHVSSQKSSGSVIESFFKDFVDYPDGIIFPRLIIETQYIQEKLISLFVVIINEARFNEDIDRNEFKVAVSKGTKVFDERSDALNPEYIAIEEDSSDVMESVRQAKAQSQPKSPNINQDIAKWSVARHVFFWTTLAVVVVLLVFTILRLKAGRYP